MILRDWQSSKAKYDANYPDSQVKTVVVDLWPMEKTEAYIVERLKGYEIHKETPDNELPECTLADRWAKPSKYALMKKGRKSAIKLFDDNEAAELALLDKVNTQSGEFYIEERKGEQWKRCEYCSVSDFCNQYQEGMNG